MSTRIGRPPTDFDTHYVVDENGCWIWSGGKDADGYGQHTGNVKAHRIYYERVHGSIPPGMCVLHRCDNPPCVNPAHLFVGTNSDNTADKVRKGRQLRGERTNTAKLTEEKVREIRAATGTIAAIGAQYGISDVSVSYIKLRRTWKHVA